MNDPGVDGPIRDAAEHIESSHIEKEQKKEEENEQDFLDPSRWWFASTACPLIAGTFGPMANAFSICALVENWRVYIPPGSDEAHGEPIRDPRWLIAVNSISLACALIANFSLLLNMAQRLYFAVAQPITIIGFFLSSFLLIALVIVASTSVFRIEPMTEHALSQAFYYGIMAAGLYCMIALLMCLTVYGAYRGHYEKEFRLTISQRTLMLQTIGFMVYLLLGALIFKVIEGWNFLDAVYWADFTLLTVGIGDYAPTTHLGKSLLFPYAIGGIVMVGLVIGSIRSLVLDRGKRKTTARFQEKKREKVLSSIDSEERTIKVGPFQTINFCQKGLTEKQRREQEFLIMRKIQKDAEYWRRWTALISSAFAAFTLWLVGAVVFWKSEQPQGWTYFQALYFAYTSLLTIGYGDYSPTSNSGKPFFVFWSLLAVPTLTVLISNMGDTVVKAFRDFTIWVGSLTVLPGEHGLKETLRSSARRISKRRLFNADDFQTLQPPGFLRRRESDTTATSLSGDEDEPREDEEIINENDSKGKKDGAEVDFDIYHLVLARELRKLIRDAMQSPPKQYTYSEWAYYLKLIGDNEADPERHCTPPIKVKSNRGNGPQVGKAGESHSQEAAKPWSWLGTRSPLMGHKSEAEWLVRRISLKLEHELAKFKVPIEEREPPPLTISDLRKRRNGSFIAPVRPNEVHLEDAARDMRPEEAPHQAWR